jgi:exopolyphosphatase / guanosine-5'-triphosphate,3'-diphosphate pyrophosphatase
MTGKRFAAIDIGTNTILCVIAQLENCGRFEVLDDLGEITRLGEGVDRTGRISAEGERRSLEILRRYVERCRELGVDEITVAGTSALRDAGNSREVRSRFREELGLEIQVLSGEEEAASSFLAVQRGLALGDQELLVIDIGGGSTEFIWGNKSGIRHARSIDIGSVRLTERFLHSDPVCDDEYRELMQAIDAAIASLLIKGRPLSSALTLVGIAGTFTTLAAVEKKLTRYSHSEVHGSSLSLNEVRRQVKLYKEKSVAERKKIPGLDPKRADVIFAGACLIERIMAGLYAERVIVSDQGVRYGLLYKRLDRPLSC